MTKEEGPKGLEEVLLNAASYEGSQKAKKDFEDEQVKRMQQYKVARLASEAAAVDGNQITIDPNNPEQMVNAINASLEVQRKNYLNAVKRNIGEIARLPDGKLARMALEIIEPQEIEGNSVHNELVGYHKRIAKYSELGKKLQKQEIEPKDVAKEIYPVLEKEVKERLASEGYSEKTIKSVLKFIKYSVENSPRNAAEGLAIAQQKSLMKIGSYFGDREQDQEAGLASYARRNMYALAGGDDGKVIKLGGYLAAIEAEKQKEKSKNKAA